jgi:transposase
MNWQHRLIVRKLAEGCLVREASEAAGVHRQTFWRWHRSLPEFAAAVLAAREAGKSERTFRLWLGHYRRGMRPPTGKGHGGKPRFAFGKR